MIRPSDLDPRLLKPGDWDAQMVVVTEVGIPWPLNTQIFDWCKTPTFATHLSAWRSDPGTLAQIMEEQRAADGDLHRKGAVTPEGCWGYLPLLSRHIIAAGLPRKYRWNTNPWPLPGCLANVNRVLEAAATGTGGMDWHDPLRAGWACLHAGLAEEALAIWSWLDSVVGVNQQRVMFPGAHLNPRGALSVKIGLATTHRLLRDPEAELGVRDQILGLWERLNYIGRNRIVESAVEAVRLDPTEERKETALELFLKMRSSRAHEPTECVREALLVAWMMLRYVFQHPLAVREELGTVGVEGGRP